MKNHCSRRILINLALLAFCIPLSSGFPADAEHRVILHNAIIFTMEDYQVTAEALLIVGNRIEEIGDDETILAMADGNTEVIDLGGRVVFPGFLDPHTHLFNDAWKMDLSLDEAQQLALENGITAVSNMFTTPDDTESFIRYAKDGNMRIRLNLYLIYNDSCGNVWGTWYEAYEPGEELAPRLKVGGVKIFAERSVCGEQGIAPVFGPKLLKHFTEIGIEAWGENQPFFSEEDLREVTQHADDHGYQVAIHAIGDLGIETSLKAISSVLQGSNNTNRHMILHNHFIRNDMLDLYTEANIIALVEPTSPCQADSYAELVGQANRRLFKRWRKLVNTGIHVGLNSDWPYTGFDGLNPMRKLYAVVTGKNAFEHYEEIEPCRPPLKNRTVSLWQGLRMMTVEAAYAMHWEDQLGSIEVGKLADLVVLSENPFDVRPDEIKTIELLMTMVDGGIEHRSEDLP